MRAISRTINKRIVRPLYYAKDGDKRLERLSELEQSQWASIEELRRQQSERVRRLIRHSYATTSYYKSIFDAAGIHPDDIRGPHDLINLPTLSKSLIQRHFESMVSSAFDRKSLIPDSSGGSTGVPTNFLKDLDRHRLRRADQMRHDQWCGWRLGEPYALLWGAQKDLSLVKSTREKIVSRVVDRSFIFDAFSMDGKGLTRFLQSISRIRPTMLIGYANALLLLAQQMKERGMSQSLGLAGAISSAETLTEFNRREIESTLGCQVLNRYGSREVGLIASECPEKCGLHINFENVVVEVLVGNRPAAPGESGEIVVTDLMNYGMPFIRYRMGDVGKLSAETCSCGRALPLLESVEGRVSDFFVGDKGKNIHGEYFTHLFYGVPEVQQFQLIQEEVNYVRLKLVTTGEIPHGRLENLIADIKGPLAREAMVEVEYCDEIPPTKSGKFLFTISKVSHRDRQ